MSRHSYRCEYETEYVLRSSIKRRIGKKGVVLEQKQTFEVPLRRVVDIEIVNVDPATGQQRKERVSRVVGLAREEKTKRLVSSPEGDTWVEEVKLVPATRPMKVDSKYLELFNVRSEHGMVGDLETVSQCGVHSSTLDRAIIIHLKNRRTTLIPEIYDFRMMRMSGDLGTCSFLSRTFPSLIWSRLFWTVVHLHELLDRGETVRWSDHHTECHSSFSV